MWSSWSEKATASLTSALEKTGDAISKAATQAGKSSSSQKSNNNDPQPTIVAIPGEPNRPEAPTPSNNKQQDVQEATNKKAAAQPEQVLTEKRKELLGNLQAGWSSVVQTTRAGLQSAHQAVEEQQHRIQEKLNEARAVAYKRDPALPLDVVALKDAEVVYITDRLISMSHPAMASNTNGDVSGERKLAAVGHLLQRRHNGRFMVWNISEVEYETRILDDQVLTFSFPGSPSPPLGLLLKLLVSMEAWLKADERNVAVIHCLTGKGRTSTVLAAFLCWMGQAGFGDIHAALDYIAACKQLPVDQLTIPSQRRYVSYFKNMLDGVRPSQPPLMLKRIIMSQAPKYAKGPPRTRKDSKATTTDGSDATTTTDNNNNNTTEQDDPAQLMGCAPYLQLFKAGQLLHTAPASLHYQQSADELPFCQVADGAISFNLNQIVQGDILVRCRHLTSKRQRVSMFRAAFHTGYVPPTVMRLKKSELDGACNDDRFPADFFLDLIFEPVHAQEASKLLQQQQAVLEGKHPSATSTETGGGDSSGANTSSTEAAGAAASYNQDAGAADAQAQALASPEVSGGTTVTASTYDSMLHRDSRFWDVISARRHEQASQQQQTSEDANANTADDKNKPDPQMWGATIGRRRDFNKQKQRQKDGTNDGGAAAGGAAAAASGTPEQRTALETFSIGGELDFLPSTVEEEQPKKKAPAKQPPKKDSLMEALMGALSEDDDARTDGPEEVVFFHPPASDATSSGAAAAGGGDGATTTATTSTTEAAPAGGAPAAAAAASDGAVETSAEAGAAATAESAQPGSATPPASDSSSGAPAPTTAAVPAAAAAPGTTTTKPASAPSTGNAGVGADMEALLAEANLDLDGDMDAILAEAGADTADFDANMLDIDEDIEDLENFLSK